jgi:hypothetical protein
VPLVRVTLDRLARGGTLDNFFRKPGVGLRSGSPADPSSRSNAGDLQ